MKAATAVLALLLCVSGAAWNAGPLEAQEAWLVPTWDPVHADVQTLVDAGLVPELPVGQGPWSVRQLRQVVVDAGATLADARVLARLETARWRYLEGVAERVARRVEDEGRVVADVFAEGYWANSPTRSTPYAGVGRIADATNPLLAYRQGRPLADDGAVTLEPAVWVAPHPRVGLHFRPRLAYVRGGPGGDDTDAGVQSLHARFLLANLAVTVGRSDVLWGRRPDEGLMVSGNARSLDMIHFTNDLPFDAGFLGPTRLSFFAADLGENQAWPHTKLFGAKFSVRPAAELELALSFLNEQGGEGAPEADFWDRVADIFIVPDLFISTRDFEFSEKLAGGEIRWWPSRDLHLFLEGAITDFDVGRLGSILTDDAAWSGGGRISGLGPRGAGWLRLAGTTTGPRFYRHEQFPSGLTLDGAILGTALGPDATGVRFEGGWEDPGGRTWSVTTAWERRSVDEWAFSPDSEPTFEKIEDHPEESRLRLRIAGRLPTERGFVEVSGGVERIGAFAFDANDDRTAVVLLVRALRGFGPF